MLRGAEGLNREVFFAFMVTPAGIQVGKQEGVDSVGFTKPLGERARVPGYREIGKVVHQVSVLTEVAYSPVVAV